MRRCRCAPSPGRSASVYIHFADRDALVFAALEQCTRDLVNHLDQAESDVDGPVAGLRARMLFLGTWVRGHAGLYKVLHESTLDQRMRLAFERNRRRGPRPPCSAAWTRSARPPTTPPRSRSTCARPCTAPCQCG